MERFIKKKIILLAGVIALVLITGISFVWTKQQIMTQQKAVIGRLYEKDAEACEMLIRDMFETDVSMKEQKAGETALVEFGYTSEGLEYLYQESAVLKLQVGCFILLVCIAAGIFYTAFLLGKQQRKKEEELVADISRCVASGEMLEAERYYVCNATLVHEISGVLKTLRAKEQELREKNQRAQKFVENIAHQIKTPLACVSISLDLLLEKLKEEEQRSCIQQSFLYLEEIETLMKKLLDMGRLESGKLMMQKAAVRLDSLLEECAELLHTGKNRFEIVKESEAEAVSDYYGDYEWLKEAFTNIMKNCLEHDDSGKPVVVRMAEKKENICIQIRDHGPGIPEEDIEHIFDRFYLPDNAKKSHTGIGLNLAELVLKKHFGTIKASNHEEGGAVFSIVLPTYGLKNEKI